MQCNQCHFENMPGLTRCFKCGSVLVASEPLDVNPPRMRRWKKPLRDFNRMIRGSGVAWQIPRPAWIKSVADDIFLGMVVSVIPGLGHYLYGRLRSVIWLLLIWLLLILGCIFMYGSSVAMFLFGLAIGLHGWIAISCSYLEHQKEFSRRVGVMAVLCLVFAFLYYTASGWIFSDFVGQYSAMNFESYKVKYGDFLLARHSLLHKQLLLPGDLVLAHAAYVGGHDGLFDRNEALVVGQIIGVPDDTVTVKEGVYSLNDKTLDRARFPVPRWLQNADISVTIPAESYFLSCEYTVGGHNFVLTNDYIRQACVIRKERINSKVFMRWLPLANRGFIKVSR
jgi:hypothetical protein